MQCIAPPFFAVPVPVSFNNPGYLFNSGWEKKHI